MEFTSRETSTFLYAPSVGGLSRGMGLKKTYAFDCGRSQIVHTRRICRTHHSRGQHPVSGGKPGRLQSHATEPLQVRFHFPYGSCCDPPDGFYWLRGSF